MPRDLRERNETLIEWLRAMYGPGRQFRSARQWSMRAGLSPSVVSAIEESGAGSCTSLIALARAAGVSPIEVMLIGGHLRPEDRDTSPLDLADREQTLLRRYKQMGLEAQDLIDEVARQLANRV